jgi:hypothetical protein
MQQKFEVAARQKTAGTEQLYDAGAAELDARTRL